MSDENEWTDEQAFEHGQEWIAVGWRPLRAGISATFGSLLRAADGTVLGTELRLGRIPLRADGFLDSDYWVSWAPDMRDDGTRGLALGRVRRALGTDRMWQREEWFTDGGDRIVEYAFLRSDESEEWDTYRGPTDAEALLAARKAAR